MEDYPIHVRYYNIQPETNEEEETHSLVHVHFLAWPDRDVPDVSYVIYLCNLVRYYLNKFDSNEGRPFVPQSSSPSFLIPFRFDDLFLSIKRSRFFPPPHPFLVLCHCSAGVGRTGTFLAVWTLFETSKFDVLDIVRQLRRQRHHQMVQTKDQYRFIYHCLITSTPPPIPPCCPCSLLPPLPCLVFFPYLPPSLPLRWQILQPPKKRSTSLSSFSPPPSPSAFPLPLF